MAKIIRNSSTSESLLLTAKSLSALLVLWWIFFAVASHGFTPVALIESLVPLVVFIATLIAWRWNIAGGLLFMLLGALYICLMWGRTQFVTYIFVSGPLFLTGLLYISAKIDHRLLPKKPKAKHG